MVPAPLNVTLNSCISPSQWKDGEAYFLIGYSFRASGTLSVSVVDAFVCEDADVAEEQLECIQRVLPAGVVAVGIGCRGPTGLNAVKAITSHVERGSAHSDVVVLCVEGMNAIAWRLREPSMKVRAETKAIPVFWMGQCVVTQQIHSLPFIVKCVRQDGSSGTLLLDVVEANLIAPEEVLSGAVSCEVVQLGVGDRSEGLVRVPVAFCPLSFSGKFLLASLQAYAGQSTDNASACTVVRVRSRRPSGLVYACRVPCREGSADSKQPMLSRKQWSDVRHVIEDATGDRADPSELMDTKVDAPAREKEPKGSGTMGNGGRVSNEQQKAVARGGVPTSLLAAAVLVAVFGILIVLAARR